MAFKNGDGNLAKLPEIRTKISSGLLNSYKNNPIAVKNHRLGCERRKRETRERNLKMEFELKSKVVAKICGCGCGSYTLWSRKKKCYNDFIKGHCHQKTTNEKIKNTLLKLYIEPEFQSKRVLAMEKSKNTKCLNPQKHDVQENFKRSESLKNTWATKSEEEKKERGLNISKAKFGHPVSEETREKISYAISNLKIPVKCKWFYSCKNQKELYYHSSWELIEFEKLEKNNNVKSYDRCHFSIKYNFEGKIRRYLPDIMVIYIDDIQEMIEVKPKFRLLDKRINTKIEAGQEYCKNNNLVFTVLTEDDIFDYNKGGDAKSCGKDNVVIYK